MAQSLPTNVPEPAAPENAADPKSGETTSSANQWRLVWRAFLKHRLAVVGLLVTAVIYLIAAFAEILAPYPATRFDADYAYAPPQRVHVVDTSKGDWDWGLYVHGYKTSMDPVRLKVTYEVDASTKVPLRLFDRGSDSYRFLGLFQTNVHVIGPVDNAQPMYLLGADRNGRDLLSRLIHGTRVSMSIGLIGVALAFVLGVSLGGVSGFFGGRTDTLIQRLVEFFMSVPTLPLWMGLAAALPSGWGPLKRYFAITVILAILAWTSLARVTRGRFLSLREEQFVSAAQLDGNRAPRLIFRHMLPSFTSYLIASLTLSIPGMILAETSLSFLGLGLQAPVVSWGVLLQEAQNVRVVATAPWLMIPGVAVVVAVLALNFVGDGLRDAADPYKR
jgi:peptide/nickel transport system permease protein